MKAPEAPRRPGPAEIVSAAVNLTKNLLGAGIFTMPIALKDGSVLPGLGILLVVGAVQASSFIMIAFLCQKLNATTYRGVWRAVFGQRSGDIVDVCITINSFFACVSYKILVADFLQKAFESLFGWEGTSRPLLIWANTLVITLPLSHARNLAPLRYTSMLGLAIIAFVFMFVVCDFCESFEAAQVNLRALLWSPSMGLFSTFALSTGAFKAHYNAPRIFLELGGDLRAHTYTVVCSFGAAFVIYASFAVAGLGLFGDEVLGNVLVNYPAEGNGAVLSSWFGMAFAVVFTFPLVFTGGRESLIGLVPALQRASKLYPVPTHVVITSGMIALISSVSCLVEDVSTVTSLLGATVGSCLCWIFPALIYLKACALSARREGLEKPLLKNGHDGRHRERVPDSPLLAGYSRAVICVGVVEMLVGVTHTLGFI